MAKKRLAEFLREEAHKSLDLEGPNEINEADEEKPSAAKSPAGNAETAKTTTAAKRSPQTKKQQAGAVAQSAEPPSAALPQRLQSERSSSKPKPSVQSSKRSRTPRTSSTSTPQGELVMTPVQTPDTNPVDAKIDKLANSNNTVQGTTQAQLDEAIAELKATLLESKIREETLQHQVEMLQAELTKQRELAQQLQTKQDKSVLLEKELEEARNVILKLSELNQQLVSNGPTAANPQSPEAPPSAASKAALPKPLPMPPDPLQLLESTPQRIAPAPVPPHQSQTTQMELRKVLKHPVTPTIPPTTLSNEEIGWVD
ncbi:MAG TPA: hypothetical protein IGS37_04315 [Synechococcales cyanobacterium M55_K2018_004]|nr:hypothetical protein [Synechococcales cyanobacterium M55_K2018_004]